MWLWWWSIPSYLFIFLIPRRKEDTVVAVESRYQSEYERKLDPFQSFSQAERKRKYGQLSVAEKVILSLVRFIVSNK